MVRTFSRHFLNAARLDSEHSSIGRKSSRLLSVDLTRVLALLFMVQGHTLDALLSPEFRQGEIYETWLFVRGLTAPIFLVLSGFSFSLATTHRLEHYSLRSWLFWRRMTRFATFILLGYMMHMPVRFNRLSTLNEEGFRSWMQVDVLQCIGVSLIALQVLAVVARSKKAFALLALILATLFVMASPLAWSADLTQSVPNLVAAYLNGNGTSLFPLFPWAGYICIGAVLAHIHGRESTTSRPRLFGVLGIALACSGLILQDGDQILWAVSPFVFLFRLGIVCFVFAVFSEVVAWMAIPRAIVTKLASHSLVIYVAHIPVVYGSSWNLGLRQRVGAVLPVGESVVYAIVLLLAMVLLVMIWSWCRTYTAIAVANVFRVVVSKIINFGQARQRSAKTVSTEELVS